MFVRLPTNHRGDTVTISVEHIAYITAVPSYRGTGSLVHLGVKAMEQVRRIKLAVVYTTMRKDEIDELLRQSGVVVSNYKPTALVGKGNY